MNGPPGPVRAGWSRSAGWSRCASIPPAEAGCRRRAIRYGRASGAATGLGARVETVHRHAAAGELLGEDTRVQHVAQLGARVRLHQEIAALEEEIFEVHGAPPVADGSDVDDARRRALDDPLEQELGEKEV